MRCPNRARTLTAFSLLLSAAVVAACAPRVEPADLVLTNGRIATVDTAKPTAAALAVRGDTIVAVGTIDEIKAYIGQKTEVIDLAGRFAMPAFVESHAHFMGVGQAKLNLELMKVKNWDEIVAMVSAAAAKAKPGDWILGRGWHQEKWDRVPAGAVEGFPTHDLLTKAAPNNPVFLTHASGHATIANLKAMELAGITKKTPNPPGGEILKDKAGSPIGVFRERASGLVGRALSAARAQRTPEQVEADAIREVEMADREYISKGVASVHDAGVGFETVDLYKKLADQGKLNVRLNVMLSESAARLAERGAQYKMVDAAQGHLTVRTIKRLMDGALGSRGAWLLEPYADLPDEHRPQHRGARGDEGHRRVGDRQRLAGRDARDRRPRQPRDAQRLRGDVQGAPRQEGRAVAHHARPAHQRRRHPALRRARRHRHHAGHSLHVGCAVRAGPARRRSAPRKAPTCGRS